MSPTARPIKIPCVKYRCQICCAKEAPTKPVMRKRTPRNIGSCVLKRRARIVTTGAESMAMAKLRPPMKAKSVGVAVGKMLLER